MKIKQFTIAQAVLLVGAVIAGLALKDNLSDGPRMVHRLSGQLAGLVGIAVAIRTVQLKSPTSWKVLAWLSVAMTFLAGFSGMMLKEASNYDTTFALMRIGGVGALALTITLLVKIIKAETKRN